MQPNTLQKGDIVKVINGPAKRFYGVFERVVPKDVWKAVEDGMRIKILMYGKYTSIVLFSSHIKKKKIIPECFRCWKPLPTKKKEFLMAVNHAVWCDECSDKKFSPQPNKHKAND